MEKNLGFQIFSDFLRDRERKRVCPFGNILSSLLL